MNKSSSYGNYGGVSSQNRYRPPCTTAFTPQSSQDAFYNEHGYYQKKHYIPTPVTSFVPQSSNDPYFNQHGYYEKKHYTPGPIPSFVPHIASVPFYRRYRDFLQSFSFMTHAFPMSALLYRTQTGQNSYSIKTSGQTNEQIVYSSDSSTFNLNVYDGGTF
jgi:hypothetical protein